ncbi:MAG: hypothetical protein ACXVJD_12280 [Mucilaginibacter sp.]
MIKACYIFLFVCFTCVCRAQTTDTCYGIVLTRITTNGKEKDTSRVLYCRNTAGDRLSVYTIAEGVVSEAIAFQLTASKNGLYLYSRLLPDKQPTDSLRIEFQDVKNTVMVNRNDRYVLFPTYYNRFKQQVKARHSIAVLLNLLADGLGDYPITSALPLLHYKPQSDKQIRKATVITQRSQADMRDTWTCSYYYGKNNKLDSVHAKSTDETRFYKKVRYHASKPVSVSTYLNIEDRQVTYKTTRYDDSNRNLLKWQEQVDELGKNRETTLSVALTRHDLGQMQKIEPTNAEVLQLLKPKKTNNDYSKKHID